MDKVSGYETYNGICDTMEAHLVGGFNPIEKIFQYSNWSISPENRDENKRYLKPPGHGNHFFFMALWTAQCGAAWCGSMPSNIQSTDLMTFQKDPTNHPNGCCVSSPAQKRSWTWSLQRNSRQKRVKTKRTQQGLALAWVLISDPNDLPMILLYKIFCFARTYKC